MVATWWMWSCGFGGRFPDVGIGLLGVSFAFGLAAGFVLNGYGENSPGGYSMLAALVTDDRAPAGFAPIAIGLYLTLIHLISIPETNTSVNPARSTGVAIFAGDWALGQLWFFWLAPIVGGILRAVIYRWLGSEKQASKR